MAVRQVEISGQNFISAMLNSFSNLYPSTGDKSSPTYTGGTNTLSIVPATNVETVIFDNSVFKITGQINNNDNTITTKFYYNNTLIDSKTTAISPSSFGAVFLGWSFLVDDDVQEGQFVYDIQYDSYGSAKYTSSSMFSSSSSYRNRRQKAYLAITESEVSGIVANGGGATHIAKITGLLSTLSSNLSDILMVSGGGGGGMLSGGTEYEGADAGGISGSGTLSGNQSTGYGFGQGEASSNTSAGGGGLYGGYKGTSSLGGGAGSGYIGNSLVSNKKMVGYNVPTSDAESTKTESTTLYSEGIMSDAAKMGNGGAKITLVKEPKLIDFFDMALSTDLDNAVNCGTSPTSAQWESTNILFWGQSSKQKPTISNNIIHYEAARDYTASSVSFPLKRSYDILGCYMKMNFIAKSQDSYHDQWILAESSVRGSGDIRYRRVQYAYDSLQYPVADVLVDETGIYEFNKIFDTVYNQNRLQIEFSYGTWEILEMKLWVLESD